MEKQPQTWEEIARLVNRVVGQLEAGDFDAILAITRGGMIPGALVSQALGLRNVLTAAVMFYDETDQPLTEPHFLQFPSDPLLLGRRILIVDDVWDSGKTAVAVRERVRQAGGIPTLAVLHFKPSKNRFPGDRPDHWASETDAWIVYPWDPEQGWIEPRTAAS